VEFGLFEGFAADVGWSFSDCHFGIVLLGLLLGL